MTRRFLILLVLLLPLFSTHAQKTKEILYVGTFFGNGSEGIYVFEFERTKGRLKQIQVVPTPESPSFIALHPSGKYLYSANRGAVEEMKSSGSVSAFGIDQKTGKLTPLNSRPSYGSSPCHISIDQSGRWAFVSHYADGNFVVLSIFDDGLIGSSSDSRKHIGNSINKERQEKSHIHATIPAPDNKFIFVSDLGTDKVYSYSFSPSDGRIATAQKPEVMVKPGSGPRHLTFHPNGKYAYASEELTSTVAVFSYNASTGALDIIQDSVRSLPESYKGTNTAADIHTDPKGRFLYMSNRGHDAIAVYSIAESGKIKLIGHHQTKGKTPRNFMIDARGQYCFVANQETDNIVLFRIDQKTGRLLPTATQVKVPQPVSLVMLTLR